MQNIELKKFLSLNLSYEFDESDSLFHKIEMNYDKNIKEKEVNELVKKQQNSKHKNLRKMKSNKQLNCIPPIHSVEKTIFCGGILLFPII